MLLIAVNMEQNKHFVKVALGQTASFADDSQRSLIIVSKLKAFPWVPYIHYQESIPCKCRQIQSHDALYSVLVATHVWYYFPGDRETTSLMQFCYQSCFWLLNFWFMGRQPDSNNFFLHCFSFTSNLDLNIGSFTYWLCYFTGFQVSQL